MIRCFRSLFVVFCAVALPAVALIAAPHSAAAAQATERLGRFDGWEAFAAGEHAARVCWAASLPKKSEHAPAKRGRAYFTVSERSADHGVDIVTANAGYTYRKGADVQLRIGTARFALYTKGGEAWSHDDRAVVAAMLKGRSLEVRDAPAKGATAVDIYDLAGFRQAHAAIAKACHRK